MRNISTRHCVAHIRGGVIKTQKRIAISGGRTHTEDVEIDPHPTEVNSNLERLRQSLMNMHLQPTGHQKKTYLRF